MDSISTRKLGFFFSDHHRWLLQHIQKRLRNHADAEDTAAETFCQMLGARVDPDSIQQPRAYLTVIARRLIFDRHRRRQLEQAYLEHLARLPDAVAPSAEEQLLLIEALVSIDEALDGLPAVVKATFSLQPARRHALRRHRGKAADQRTLCQPLHETGAAPMLPVRGAGMSRPALDRVSEQAIDWMVELQGRYA